MGSSIIHILGIDPGLANTGWGVIAAAPLTPARLVAFGVIDTPAGLPIQLRLHQIQTAVAALLAAHRPAVLAIEQLFFAKNAKTAMAVAHGRGAALTAAGAMPTVEVVEFTPLQIKLALTGKGNAGKLQVQHMVRVVLALAEIPRPNHAADALAAALTHAHSLRISRVSAPSALQTSASSAPASAAETARQARKALLSQRRR